MTEPGPDLSAEVRAGPVFTLLDGDGEDPGPHPVFHWTPTIITGGAAET